MGAKSSTPEYEVVDGRAYDKKTGRLRRAYYDHYGIIRFQLIEKEHNGPLEFDLVNKYNETAPPFSPGDSVFVMHTRWVGEWAAFAGYGDKQPGPISNHKLIAPDGKFKEELYLGQNWRAVTKWHFLFFVCTYGLSGPVVEFKAPTFIDTATDGSRLGKKENDGTGGEETKEEGKQEGAPAEGGGNDDDEEEGEKEPVKAQVLGTKAPVWLKFVDLNRHAITYRLEKLSASINAFSTGLPYGENLNLEDDDSNRGLNAAGSILTSNEVRPSSAHVLSIIDAQASGRRRLSPLLVLLAMHAFMEAGARRAKSRNALARKAAKREHRKAVFKQKRLENKRRKSALEKFNAERSERASLIEQGQLVEDKEAREELFPGSPVVAAGIYGEELRLLAKAGKVLKQFRAMKSNDVGTQALMMMVALTFKFSGRCMGRRRLQALRVMGAPPSDSLKHGAVKVLQVSWRLCMAKVKHRELKSQDKESMVPIAVALIQINWRVSLQTLERRRRRRAYKAERLAVASGKAASVVQKALRNRWDRAKIARVRNVFRGEILAFAAVKVQMAYRKNYMRRLQMIANGDEDDIEDIDDTKPPIFGVRTPKQAEGKLSILLAQHKNDLAQRIQALAEAKQALHRSSSTINSANKIKIAEELEKKRNDIRPISLTVLGCQQVPLPNGAMKDIMQSDLFFIVSALPSPPPAECLIGGENAPNAKRRGSATALMMNNTTVSNTEAKYQRGACFSMPAKAVHTSATERSKGAVDGINVVWKQEVALSGETLNGKSTLVFTLLRRPPKKSGVLTSSTGYRDEFIGQATIKLTDLPDLWSYDEASSSSAAGQAAGGGGGGQTTTSRNGREVTVDLNIGDLKCRVWDGKGNKLKVDRKEWNGAGKLRVSFLKQDDQSLFNGWMKVSTQSPNQMKTASLNDKTKSATTMEKRWVLLSNGRLSIHETYYIEPDIEIALETINGCRVDQQGFLYIDFDRVAASKIAIKRGRGNGTGGAGQGVAQGSFSFGTGPSSLKASVAVQSASTLTGVLMLAPGTGGNEVTALRKCIEKALFLRTHGN